VRTVLAVGNSDRRKHRVSRKKGTTVIRIVLIADTHKVHRELDIAAGDLLIHAGDFTFWGNERSDLRDFDNWLGELPHAFKVVVPGNHEFVLENPRLRDEITNAELLIAEGIEIAGLKIWGSPVTPLERGAFGISKPGERKQYWAQVPDGLDILITHGPPLGILDCAPGTDGPQGDPELLEAVDRTKPRLHVFGHIHGACGTLRREDTLFVNACVYGEFGALQPPIVVELDPVRTRARSR
jgi:Icc-related predicted phosphoesterase